jgi:predicted nuclease of predicted toxin-antitoxin system
MKIKLDENLPASLVELLTAAGHDADTAPQEGLTGQRDSTVWQATQAAGRFLITQDLDFSDVRKFAPGTHHGLLVLRLSDPSRRKLVERLRYIVTKENVEQWSGCFVVATDRKIRVRRSHQ